MNITKSKTCGGYQLRQGSRTEPCPNCGKDTLKPYVDAFGNMLDPMVGRCNREIKCGYHFKPRDFYAQTGKKPERIAPRPVPPSEPELPPIYLEPELVAKSVSHFEENCFIKFLLTLFDKETVQSLIDRFFIGTSKHWDGATVFFQIGTDGKIHRGKVMLYNPATGRRQKRENNQAYITSVHALLGMRDRKPSETLFGAHLLAMEPFKSVCIVESEKTAIICSALMPEKNWLATGMLGNLKPELFEVLQDREITLYPDLGAFEKWQEKAKSLHRLNISISRTLEDFATHEERVQGLDLADFLIRDLQQAPPELRTKREPLLTPIEEKPVICEALPDTSGILDNSVKLFLVSNTRPHDAGFINKDKLISWYWDFCKASGFQALDRYKFIGTLEKLGCVIGQRLVFGLEEITDYVPEELETAF